MAITLVVFMAAINLIAYQYGQGVMRTAADEAVRAGSLQGAPGGAVVACQSKGAEVLQDLVDGPFGRHIQLTCTLNGGQLVAVAGGTLPAWLRVVPADTVKVTATAMVETNPTPTS